MYTLEFKIAACSAGELSHWALPGCRVHHGLWRVTKIMEVTGSWTFDLEMSREDARCMWVYWQTSQIPLLSVFKWGKVTMADFWTGKHNFWLLVDKAFSTRWPTNHVRVFFPRCLSLSPPGHCRKRKALPEAQVPKGCPMAPLELYTWVWRCFSPLESGT